MVSLCGRGFESHQLHYELKDVYFILKHASFNCFLILISEFYLQKVESEMLKKVYFASQLHDKPIYDVKTWNLSLFYLLLLLWLLLIVDS